MDGATPQLALAGAVMVICVEASAAVPFVFETRAVAV